MVFSNSIISYYISFFPMKSKKWKKNHKNTHRSNPMEGIHFKDGAFDVQFCRFEFPVIYLAVHIEWKFLVSSRWCIIMVVDSSRPITWKFSPGSSVRSYVLELGLRYCDAPPSLFYVETNRTEI